MNNLIFGAQTTIAQLKTQQGVNTVSISQNKETNKKRFTCGAVIGPVAVSFDSSKDTIISSCTSPDTGETFMMLHNRDLGEIIETL
jgi:hypothetical protein